MEVCSLQGSHGKTCMFQNVTDIPLASGCYAKPDDGSSNANSTATQRCSTFKGPACRFTIAARVSLWDSPSCQHLLHHAAREVSYQERVASRVTTGGVVGVVLSVVGLVRLDEDGQ